MSFKELYKGGEFLKADHVNDEDGNTFTILPDWEVSVFNEGTDNEQKRLTINVERDDTAMFRWTVNKTSYDLIAAKLGHPDETNFNELWAGHQVYVIKVPSEKPYLLAKKVIKRSMEALEPLV